MNIKNSIQELEVYFQEEGNSPEVINNEIKQALLAFAPICAHPQEMEVEGLEKIGMAIQHLSEIIDIIDRHKM